MGAVESISPKGDVEVHRVRTGPFLWLDTMDVRQQHREWLQDEGGHNGLTGVWFCSMHINAGENADDQNRYLDYYFEDIDTAFKFKMRWA